MVRALQETTLAYDPKKTMDNQLRSYLKVTAIIMHVHRQFHQGSWGFSCDALADILYGNRVLPRPTTGRPAIWPSHFEELRSYDEIMRVCLLLDDVGMDPFAMVTFLRGQEGRVHACVGANRSRSYFDIEVVAGMLFRIADVHLPLTFLTNGELDEMLLPMANRVMDLIKDSEQAGLARPLVKLENFADHIRRAMLVSNEMAFPTAFIFNGCCADMVEGEAPIAVAATGPAAGLQAEDVQGALGHFIDGHFIDGHFIDRTFHR